MDQQLIVEGKDSYAVSKLLQHRGLERPKGCDTDEKIAKFFISAGGYDSAIAAFKEGLENSDLTNIGLVIDANNAGAVARWETIKNIIVESRGDKLPLDGIEPTDSGIILREADKLTIGIWIMPNNQSNGYLEHFLSELVDQDDPLWEYAQNTITYLGTENLQRFSPVKLQKALLHTWLAWQEEPGRPFGTAIQAGYLNANAAAANHFETWFRATFLLSE